MASDRYPNSHLRRQEIPLQDLNRPLDSVDEPDGPSRLHWRSSQGRRSFRQSFTGRVNTTYSRVQEDGAQDLENERVLPHVTTPRSAHRSYVDDDGEPSPINPGELQNAMLSFGLTFDAESPQPFDPPGPSKPPASRRRSTLNVVPERDETPAYSLPSSHTLNELEVDGYFSPLDTDQTPLTSAAPISGTLQPEPQGAQHNRIGSRLGDDLPNLETGRAGRPNSSVSSRSLASGGESTLSRAGTMLRKASQRIVNLSNEPDAIDSSLRRDRVSKEGRMEGPPALPAMEGYAVDDRPSFSAPTEKVRPNNLILEEPQDHWAHPNPLRGKTLGCFGSDNWIRRWLCELLVHPFTEPVILILIVTQTIVLAVDSAKAVSYPETATGWADSPTDIILLCLFVIYTLEIVAKVIVSGLWKNAAEYSTTDASLGLVAGWSNRLNSFFTPQRQNSIRRDANAPGPELSVLRSFTNVQVQVDQPGHTRQAQRIRLARRAFLRHGFNRLDLVAVVSFWISFGLEISMVEPRRHVYIFRMLSCLRILRLLGLTSGTSVILRSLKKAAPLLVNVAFLISFFWLLFAIVGVQAFKASFLRTCVWFEDTQAAYDNQNYIGQEGSDWFAFNQPTNNIQFCGGYLNDTTGVPLPWPWLTANFRNATNKHKGYLCPVGSLCLEGTGPYNGTVNFNNVLQSLQLVFVIMSANTFSDLLYYTTDSDFLAGALFFAFGIVILSLWLTNLLVAVITSSFQVIREESKTSAFTLDDEQYHFLPEEEQVVRISWLRRLWEQVNWLWIIIILFDLIVMCLRSSNMSPSRERFIDDTETVVTFVLLVEICLRFLVDWRNFRFSGQNWVDLGLAIITAVIQIPPIHNSGQTYSWLTFFQIVRIYRVVLAVPITRDLILKVLGNMSGLLNLIVFVFLITFLTAIFAVQIFRGEFPTEDVNSNPVRINFSDIYNSFIGMYQVLSSENWTILMYNATQYELHWSTAWIGATFLVLWFILANFIVLNMFIAVIQENFDVSEDEKRLQQVKAFLQQKELGGTSHGNLSLSTIFKLGRDRSRHRDPLDYGPATMEMLLQEAVIRDFLDEHIEPMEPLHEEDGAVIENPSGSVKPSVLSFLWTRILGLFGSYEPNPFYSRMHFPSVNGELDIHRHARQVFSLAEQRKKAQRQYLQRHPTYNVSLFIFSPTNPVRRFCQRIVGPGRGSHRIEGVDPIKPVWYVFSAFIYAAIVAMVLIACITTPLYQKEYFQGIPNPSSVGNWFLWSDVGFAMVFTVEAAIKVIADGFFWTPNAYFRESWGFIDGVVLVTLWINVATSLYKDGAVSRAVGAFKALRALRLLNVSDSARETFHSIIILGGWKVISAAFVSLSLLFPFAIYGLNLFNGQFMNCNDNGFSGNLTECIGEYNNKYLYSSEWNVLSPRQAANPYFSFDNFGHSLSILFQIVSQEGWTDVMWQAMQAAGRLGDPQPYQSQGNAVFFIIFNLLGSVFVLTLFVSVFMRNYTEQTGVAFLTAEQRSWLELRKLLRQMSPSKRPSSKSEQGWRAWCYRVAVKKHGRWQRFLTVVLLCHLILLLLEWYPEPEWWRRLRDFMFLAFTLFYIANIAVRIIGLTWKRFRRSSWDLYAVLSVTGTVVTTLLDLSRPSNRLYQQLHKLFLVSIALLLIPRNNQLDQLFKTAAASLSAIGNLLATWFVLFLVYAIALTQTFGLTRFGNSETGNLNFRNVPKALILLFRMSCGEGWNQIMEDFATITPPYCVADDSFLSSDCGSAGWARSLFISWNILSMYIFVSLFVSLIYESFSYVYQRSSGLAIVNREEIRRFKQAWATYDPEGTGFISKEIFPRLLGELSGIFEMRIYAGGDHSVGRILENCRVEPRRNETHMPGVVVHGVNLAELNRQLRMIDRDDIRRRRQQMETFYQEIMVSAHPDKGVNFTSCLMILAHYKVISDQKSLRLEEYLRRRARLQRVEEEVNRRVVRGFFDTVHWTRRFRGRLDLRQSARMVHVPQFAVPEIFIDDQDALSPRTDVFRPVSLDSGPDRASSSDRPRPSLEVMTSHHGGGSPARSQSRSRSDRAGSLSPQLSPRKRSSLSPQHSPSHSLTPSGDYNWNLDGSHSHSDHSPIGGRSRSNSALERQNVLEVFDNSAWGESIRRSFTLRRSGIRARGGGGGSRREPGRLDRPSDS